MSLFSFLRKNEQESAADDGSYYSRAEEDSQATRTRKRKPASPRDNALDPVLPEKKRARRRLVGAVALVLAAVIGLPMMLDSEPRPLAEDISVQIPSRDAAPPVTAPAAEDDAEALAAVTSEARAEIVEPVEAAPPPAQVRTEAEAPATVATPAQSAPVATATPPPVPAPTASAPAAASKPATSAAKPAVAPPRADDGARALALLEGRPIPGASDGKAEKFVIQVAALASQEKVNALRGTLERAGIASFTQKVATSSGNATRIRVGPFASREEAEKMRARIVKLGLNGTLVPA